MVIDQPKRSGSGPTVAKAKKSESSSSSAGRTQKEASIYIDGEFFSEANAKISVFDHGLLYGDGVFEGIRFYNGRVFRLEEHIERLWDSARSICLEIPISRNEMREIQTDRIRTGGKVHRQSRAHGRKIGRQ